MKTIGNTEGNCYFCKIFFEADIISNPKTDEGDRCLLPDGEKLEAAIMFGPRSYICPKFKRGRPQGIAFTLPNLFDHFAFLYGESFFDEELLIHSSPPEAIHEYENSFPYWQDFTSNLLVTNATTSPTSSYYPDKENLPEAA